LERGGSRRFTGTGEDGLLGNMAAMLGMKRQSGDGGGSKRPPPQPAAIPVNDLKQAAKFKAEEEGGVAATFAVRLENLDKNGDGMVDANELINCMEQLVQEEKLRKQFLFIALACALTTVITVAVILGLSIVIGERLKDTTFNGGSSVMVVKGSTDPVQVANNEMTVVNGSLIGRAGNGTSAPISVSTKLTKAEACPISMSNTELVHMSLFSLPLPNGNDFFVKVDGFVRSYTPPGLTLFTPVGEINILNDCAEMTGAGMEYLASKGYLTLKQGRHLLARGLKEGSAAVINTYYTMGGSGGRSGSYYIPDYYGR